MLIYPVLDLLGGQAVRGVAGRRSEYLPVQSQGIIGSVPLDVARGLAARYGFRRFYIADLDGILHDQPDWPLYAALRAGGLTALVDLGLRRLEDAHRLVTLGHTVIAGLESCPGREWLAELIREVGAECVVFSLDLKGGKPLVAADWGTHDPMKIATLAIDAGVRRMLVLDLAGVGVSGGIPNAELRLNLHRRYPDIEWLTGGGVRDLHDLRELEQSGVAGVLVASALHVGTFSPHDLAAWIDRQ